MTLKSPCVCLSRKLALFLTVKYHSKISVLNLRKYLTIKIDCNPGPWSLIKRTEKIRIEYSPVKDPCMPKKTLKRMDGFVALRRIYVDGETKAHGYVYHGACTTVLTTGIPSSALSRFI